MLERWKIRNFKSVKKETELQLSALTVFAGANSSGKSTFIQSILLTTQTLGSPVHSRQIVLNGRLLRLGSMSDIVHHSARDSTISLGFVYSVKGPHFWPIQETPQSSTLRPPGDEDINTISCDYTFAADPDIKNQEQSELRPVVMHCRLKTGDTDRVISSVDISRSAKPPLARAHELNLVEKSLSKDDLETLDYEVSGDESHMTSYRRFYLPFFPFDFLGAAVGARLMHFLPESLTFRYDMIAFQASSVVQAILGTYYGKPTDGPLSAPLFNKIIEIAEEAKENEKQPPLRAVLAEHINLLRANRTIATASELAKRSTPALNEMLSSRRQELQSLARVQDEPQYSITTIPIDPLVNIRSVLFEKIRYIGPLRDDPKQFYSLEGAADPTDVGLRGEFTAAVLTSHRNLQISYISSLDWKKFGTAANQKLAPLHVAVVDWLQHMGVVSDLEATDRGVYGHNLQVSIDQSVRMHSLVHVGVGVSQVLPILVMALIAKPGSILILEQPELHLHPRVQTRLADFLLSVSYGGKQCIVETHSEYLINRLRLRAAEDATDKMLDVFSMYYVSKKDDETQYDSVPVNEYGAIQNWPDGFFDQSPREAERILQAAVRKRARSKAPK